MKQLSKTKPYRTGKLALIFLAFVFVIAGGNAYAGDTPPKEPYKGWIGPPPVKDSEGAKEKAPKKLPTEKETPTKSAPPVPTETAKALNPTKKAGPDPSEFAEKAGQ